MEVLITLKLAYK